MAESSTSQLTRRRFMLASAVATGGTLFGSAACAGPNAGNEGGGQEGGRGLQWWDHYGALQDLHRDILNGWSRESGIPVKYTYNAPPELAEALQLAHQSNQLPDIFSLSPSMGVPVQALVEGGWFEPLNLSEEALGRLPEDALVNGITTIDGEIYSFPIFSSRWHQASVWINKRVYEQAGLDPANPPGTYDEFRAACRTVRRKVGGQTYGFMANTANITKLGNLAQAAGFEGSAGTSGQEGMLYRTGEYALDSDQFVNVVEFLVSLQRDGLMYPGSNTTLEPNVARARWAAGGAAFKWGGPWAVGIVKQDFPQFVDHLGVGKILVPEPGMSGRCYAPPYQGAFYMRAGAKQQDAANSLLAEFTTKEYYTGLAQSMDQPPLDLSAVEEAEGVHPVYRQIVRWFAEDVFFEPSPITRNVEVSKVLAERKPITPDFENIVDGTYSNGRTAELRKSLKQLSDKLNRELDRAIAEARSGGAKVSRDDFAFPDWQPGRDYTYG